MLQILVHFLFHTHSSLRTKPKTVTITPDTKALRTYQTPSTSVKIHIIGPFTTQKTTNVDKIDEMDIPCTICGSDEPLYWLNKEGWPICYDCAEYQYAGFFTKWLIRKKTRERIEFWNRYRERKKNEY